MSLRFVYFIERGLVGDGFDAVLQRQNVIIAGRDHHGLELKPFGEVHCADGNAPFAFFHAIGKLQRCLASFLYDRTRPRQFVRTTDEYANFIGFGAVFYDFTNPKGKVVDFLFAVVKDSDNRIRAIEDRDGSPPIFLIAIHISHKRR